MTKEMFPLEPQTTGMDTAEDLNLKKMTDN